MLSLLSVGFVYLVAVADPVAPAPSSTRSLSPAHELLLTAPDRRVRVTDRRLRSILAEGITRSRTFAGLVTSLNRSDVIVYVETVMTLPKDTMGRLTLLPLAGEYRYLRVQIRQDLSRREAIALIGHELQHALEIAEATEVRDTSGLIRLYERIGHTTKGDHAYDTDAAQNMGRLVRRELAG